MITINVTTGPFWVTEVLRGVTIRLLDPEGSVRLGPRARLIDAKVDPAHAQHHAPAVVLEGDGARLENVDVLPGAGQDGIVLEGDDTAVWQGTVAGVGAAGVRVQGDRAQVIGVTLHTCPEGIQVEAPNAEIIGCLTYVPIAGEGIVVTGAGQRSQIIRCRARQNHGAIDWSAVDEDDTWAVLVLNSVEDGQDNVQHGERALFLPPWYTVGTEESFQGPGRHDFPTPQAALAQAQPGDRFLVDASIPNWGDLVVATPDVWLVGLGGRNAGESGGMKGVYLYHPRCGTLTVTATACHVQNWVPTGPVTLRPDTVWSRIGR